MGWSVAVIFCLLTTIALSAMQSTPALAPAGGARECTYLENTIVESNPPFVYELRKACTERSRSERFVLRSGRKYLSSEESVLWQVVKLTHPPPRL